MFVSKDEKNVKPPKRSFEEEDWKRLEKWRVGRANYP